MLLLLETERLILRPFTDDDAPFIVELLNHTSFLEHIGDKGVRTEEDALRYLREGPLASWARHGHGLYAVEIAESGETIGMCGLLKRDHLDYPDLGYAYLPRFWKNGYALEAARAVLAATPRPSPKVAEDSSSTPRNGERATEDESSATRVLAIVTPANHSSIRMLDKLGFRRAPDHPDHPGAQMYSLELR
ncbi:MAG: GNAT family N-acetyltransferase [Acidobacteria bacterium]|nr:GNAT family N-acetyltransferase [Acidobacteriota bacterium]